MMNDFGEMSETGVVLSNSEMRERRLKRGECETCGMKCFKKTLFKSTPITENGKVLNGRCLICHPLDVSEMISSPVTAQVEIASSKDLHRANRSMGTLYLSAQSRLPKRGLSRRAVSDGNVNDAGSALLRQSGDSSTMNSMKIVEEEGTGHIGTHESEHKHINEDTLVDQVPIAPKSPSRAENQQILDHTKSNGVHESVVAMAASLQLQRNFREMKAKKNISSCVEEPKSSPQEKRWEITKQDSITSTASSTGSRSIASSKGGRPTVLDEAQAIKMIEEPNCKFSRILEIVQDYPNVESVEGSAVKVIAEGTVKTLAEPEVRMLLDKKATGVKFILSKLRSDSIESSQRACNAIYNLITNQAIKEAAIKNGGVECIVGNFERFPNNIEMQKVCLNCLERFGDVSESYFYMLCEGVDKHVIDAMIRSSEHVEIQKCCCDVIIKLSKDSSLRTGIVDANGAGQIAITMVMFSDDLGLLDKALRSLRSLSYDSSDNKIAIADSGAVDSIVSTMQKHRDDAKIQALAARTLGEIGSNVDTALIVGNCGGIDVITRAIFVHDKRQNVIKRSCIALENLSHPNDNRLLMVEIGVINALIYTMQSNPDSAEIQILCFNILSNLAEGSGRTEVIKKKIVEQEALDSISMSMVMHGGHEKLQEAACSLLCNLVCEANYESLIAGGAPELMKVASDKFYACRGSMDYMVMMLDRIRP